MNIFVVDEDPVKAAQSLCDVHVVKMILESAQMLSTAVRHWGYEGDRVYKAAYPNHPCTKWVCESRCNFWWLLKHTYALCDEYKLRYSKAHKSTSIIDTCHFLLLYPPPWFQIPRRLGISTIAQAMPEEYKHEDAVTAYRRYYVNEKTKLKRFGYKLGNEPEWLYDEQYKIM